MSNVIIGIHGLANKPSRAVLARYWRSSIDEGLQKNCRIAKPRFKFQMVYWADLLYKSPLHNDELFDFDELYNQEPYMAATQNLKTYEEGFLDGIRAGASAFVGAAVDFAKEQFGMDSLADWVIRKNSRIWTSTTTRAGRSAIARSPKRKF